MSEAGRGTPICLLASALWSLNYALRPNLVSTYVARSDLRFEPYPGLTPLLARRFFQCSLPRLARRPAIVGLLKNGRRSVPGFRRLSTAIPAGTPEGGSLA